jgi:hypothetical protein
LKEFGSNVKFNYKCLHRGYKRGSNKTFLSAQIFSAPMGLRSTAQNTVANFVEGTINKDNLPVLKSISKDILQGWDEKYRCKKYKAPKMFKSRKVNQRKTCRIDQQCFSDTGLDKVNQLIDIFQTIYPNDIWVTLVWFLKEKIE